MGWRHHLLIFCKGMAMGAADVVPGVSGGTIAFISGIYDELVDSLKGIKPELLRVLVRQGPASFWKAVNGNFLVALFSGVLFSIFSLAKMVSYLLEQHPVFIWSFFFGLILASIVYVIRQQPHWAWTQILGLIAGAVTAAGLAFSPSFTLSVSPMNLFFAGMVAVCAMILPGVSGSFLLLLMGVYSGVIGAISRLDVPLLAAFACGAIVGLMGFSHLLSWLLHRHRASTLSVLIGFLLGSLPVVWPWKDISDAGVRVLLWPGEYSTSIGAAYPLLSGLMMALGFVLVLGLEYAGLRYRYGQEARL